MISAINIDKKKIITICTVILFIFACFIRIFYISQKVGIHIDEGYTHVISNFNEYQWEKKFDTHKIYTGKELKNLTFKNNTNIKEALQDVIKLRKNNDNDTCHCTLYNSIYLLWTQGKSPISPQTFIYKGCGLNLLFFILSFFVMYKILQKLFPNSYVIIPGLALAYLNTGSISNTLFIRPYQLQELAFVVLTYIFIINFQKLKAKENIINLKNGIFISLSLAFAILTGYFSLLYIGILGSILLFVSFKNKQLKNLQFLIGCCICALIIVFAFYPGFLNGFTSMRAEEVTSKIETNPINFIFNFIFSLSVYIYIIKSYFIYTPLLILMVLAFYLKKEKFDKLQVLLVSFSIIYSFIVMNLAPYKVLRYIVPIFPIISIFLPMFINGTKNIIKKILFILSILLIIIYAICPYSTVDYIRNNPNHYFSSKIENINNTKYENYKFIQQPEVPVVIINNPEYSCCLNLIFNMPDNQKYEFIDSTDKIPDKYKHYFLLVESKNSNSKLKNFKLPKNYKSIDTFNITRFQGYELVRE